jgi:hypothetical protein
MKILLIFVFGFLIENSMMCQIIGKAEQLSEGACPSLSPNNENILWFYNNNYWTMDMNTKIKNKISSVDNNSNPSWCPNNKSIIFQKQSPKSKKYSLWTINIDGTNAKKMDIENSVNSNNVNGMISRDSRFIVWTHDNQLWICDINGKNAKPLTKNIPKGYELILDWSLDNSKILNLKNDNNSNERDNEIWWFDLKSNVHRKTLLKNVFDAKFVKDNNSIWFTKGDNYLSKYYLTTDKVLTNLIKIDNDNETLKFQISTDNKTIIFDNAGPYSDAYICIMKINN